MLVLEKPRKIINRLTRSATIATWSSFAVKAGSFLFLYPFVLRGYSKEEIAYWLVASLPASMLGIIDAGMTPTAIRFFSYGVSNFSSEKENDNTAHSWDLSAIIGTVRFLYKILTVVCFVLSTAAAVWLSMNYPKTAPYIAGWVFTVLATVIYFWSFQHQAWLQATGRIPELRYRETRLQLAATLVSAALAICRLPIISIVIVNAGALLLLAFLHWRSSVEGPFGTSWKRRALLDKEIARSLYQASWRSGIGVLCGYGLTQGVCTWYATATTPAETAQFLLSMRLLQIASQVSQAPFYTKIPVLSVLYAQRNISELIAVSLKGIQRSIWAFAILGFGVSVMAPIVLSSMKSNTQLMPPLWLAVAVFALGLERCGAMLVQLYTVSNVVHWHWINSMLAVIAIGAGLLLWTKIGLISIPLAWCIATAFFYIPTGYVLTRKMLGTSQARELILQSVPALVVLLAVGSISVFFIPRLL